MNGNGARIFVGPSEQMVAAAMIMRPPQAPNAPGPSPAMQARREAMSGLSLGDYYVVAVDDMEPDDSRDPAVLDRLRSSAVRVALAEGVETPVQLGRVSVANAMSKR